MSTTTEILAAEAADNLADLDALMKLAGRCMDQPQSPKTKSGWLDLYNKLANRRKLMTARKG